jgi:hypothetical protein
VNCCQNEFLIALIAFLVLAILQEKRKKKITWYHKGLDTKVLIMKADCANWELLKASTEKTIYGHLKRSPRKQKLVKFIKNRHSLWKALSEAESQLAKKTWTL